jgi:hypothetical protein
MPTVGFEPTISVFERVKTIHALDRAANVIDSPNDVMYINSVRTSQGAYYFSVTHTSRDPNLVT